MLVTCYCLCMWQYYQGNNALLTSSVPTVDDWLCSDEQSRPPGEDSSVYIIIQINLVQS